MRKIKLLLIALLLGAASCSDPEEGGVDVTTPPAETITFEAQPDDLSFDYNFAQDEEVEFGFALDAVTSDLAASSISTIPATSDNFEVTIAKGDSTNRFVVKFRAKRSAAKINERIAESIKICVKYGNDQEVISEPFELAFPKVITVPTFIEQPDTVTFAPYFEAGTAVSFNVEIESAGAEAEDLDFKLLKASKNFTLSYEPTDDEDIYKVTFTATQAAVDAVVAARQDSLKHAKNHIIEYANLTMSHDKLGDKHHDNSPLFRVMYIMDDIAPTFNELPAADFLMNFRTDTTAVSSFIIDPGTKPITAESFSAEANEYFTVEFAEGEQHNEYRAIFTPTEAAVAETDAFETQCNVSIAYDDSMATEEVINVKFAADVDILPLLAVEIDSVSFNSKFGLDTAVMVEFVVCPGSHTVEAADLSMADTSLVAASFANGDEPNHFVMTLTAKQAAVNIGYIASGDSTTMQSIMFDGENTLGNFNLVIPQKINLKMEFLTVASSSIVYRVEISGLTDDEVIDKGVARTRDMSVPVAQWEHGWAHGATTLAYIGIKCKLAAGDTYYACPYVKLKDGSIFRGKIQIFTTYESADLVPRRGECKWYWKNPWFYASTTSNNHKDSDPLKETDDKAIKNRATIAKVMDSACYYYSVYCTRPKNISTSYITGVATADSQVNGQNIRFGHSMGYSTALHEISHSMGTGGGGKWKNVIFDANKKSKGEHTNRLVREYTNDPTALLSRGDSGHHWPYNMNYSTEYKSEEDAIMHAMVIEAMIQDGM